MQALRAVANGPQKGSTSYHAAFERRTKPQPRSITASCGRRFGELQAIPPVSGWCVGRSLGFLPFARAKAEPPLSSSHAPSSATERIGRGVARQHDLSGTHLCALRDRTEPSALDGTALGHRCSRQQSKARSGTQDHRIPDRSTTHPLNLQVLNKSAGLVYGKFFQTEGLSGFQQSQRNLQRS